MRHFKIIPFLLFCLNLWLVSCGQENVSRNTAFFKDTKAYDLAKAVEKGDLETIEKLVKEDFALLEFSNPVSGSNVLVLCLYVEQLESFKKLLELGANPNFINPHDKYSVLIYAIKPFGSQFEWRKENQYAKLLLEYGADPSYAVENDFTNEKGHHISATSPLMKASNLYLDMVKLLIKKGADPYKKLGNKQETPFSEAVSGSKFEIIDYYIDTLSVDVHRPMRVRTKDSLFVQDYIKTFMSYKDGTEGDENKQKLIKKLELIGVDFKNYNYEK